MEVDEHEGAFMQRQVRSRVEPAQDVIDDLAKRTHRPVEQVKVVYEQQLAILEADAKVTVFLAVLAKRRAKEVLSRL
jgi:hypothetical protein